MQIHGLDTIMLSIGSQCGRTGAVRLTRAVTSLITGPPGGGKGTLSKKIVADFDVAHISTGDVLRAHVREGTELGKSAEAYMNKGDLVPDGLIIDLVLHELKENAAAHAHAHVLLDGFPRTAAQAHELAARDIGVDLVLDLCVPAEDIVTRISNRWTHAASGRVYSYDFNPPKVEGLDDETGEPLIQRDDDKPDTVRARLAAYEELTAPLTAHYDAQADTSYQKFTGDSCPDLIAQDRRSEAIWSEMRPILAERLV